MNKGKLALLICICLASASSVNAANISDDGNLQLHGYGMVGGDFQGELGRPKNMSLHMDPTGPNQDPRGKMGDLGNSYWHDYFTALAVTKKWQDVGAPGQWADYTYQVVGYGDKSIETAQNYGRFGGLSFLPAGSNVWGGRRYLDERVTVFAYNTKEVHIDSGVGYSSKDLDLTIGTAQVDWSGSLSRQAIEGSRRIFDIAYRIGPSEWGITYVKELDNPLGPDTNQAISFSGKYMLPSFLGLAHGNTIFKAQYGRGVIAQYLNTSRISVLSEEGDSSMRFTMDGSIDGVEGFTIKPALIYEYTNRDDTVPRTTFVGDEGHGGIGNYGSSDETGIFAGINVQQKLHQNWSMLYEAVVNNTHNKNGVEGATGVAYKLAVGPALQLEVQPYVAPIASVTVAYVGGDRDITNLTKDSEWRLGYRLEVFF
ncbi:carbohydrate porin [Dickeya dianthicola]|uniref:carbohydrate porin n=1 Tax=Dickeya dianthicola TaxID=204039 RepID=UPI001867F196|nr:carbohydrate porin [Dickeya dianthicola]QOL15563.1 lactam utilization protein LamB [Dickeya dianthicola]